MVKLFHIITFNRWNTKLINSILDNPFNARGFYFNNPQYYYNDVWYVLNTKCNRILKQKRI